MIRILIPSLVVALTSLEVSAVNLRDQNLRILSLGKNVGMIHMLQKNTSAGIVLENSSSGTLRSPTNGNKIKFSVGAKHTFDESWKWKSSEIFNANLSPKPATITVVGNKIVVKTQLGTKERLQSFEFKGPAYPRRGFYSYLRSLSKPPAVMDAQEVTLFDEPTFRIKKVTWSYLGPEKIGGLSTHKYEIKNGFETIVQVDDKGNVVKIRELDLGGEFTK